MSGPATGGSRLLVLDTTCLSHLALADRLDVLRDLLIDDVCLTTRVVSDELAAGMADRPQLRDALDLDWLDVVALEDIDELNCFVKWTSRLGSGTRNHGEASVFAVAELRSGIAITDDRDAVRVGRAYGLNVHGTIWLLANACRAGKLTERRREPHRRPAAYRDAFAVDRHGVLAICTGIRASPGVDLQTFCGGGVVAEITLGG